MLQITVYHRNYVAINVENKGILNAAQNSSEHNHEFLFKNALCSLSYGQKKHPFMFIEL